MIFLAYKQWFLIPLEKCEILILERFFSKSEVRTAPPPEVPMDPPLYCPRRANKHETLNQYWFNVGPASKTVGQNQTVFV